MVTNIIKEVLETIDLSRGTEILENSYQEQTKSLITITEAGNEIVNGNVFGEKTLFSLDTSGIRDVGVVTPANKDIRFSSISVSSDVNYITLHVYEDVTFTGDNELTIINANRQSSNVSGAVLYDSFTVAPNISGASLIDIYATLGGTGIALTSSGGSQEGTEYKVLKRNCKYLFRYTNLDGDGASILGGAAWIETDLTD